jgi:hypothetical protein
VTSGDELTRDRPIPTPPMFWNNTFQQHIPPPTNSLNPIVLPMGKSINKAEATQAAVEAYKNDPELTYPVAAKIHKVFYQSVINYCSGEKKHSPDYYEARQKFSSIEESVLVVYSRRALLIRLSIDDSTPQ